MIPLASSWRLLPLLFLSFSRVFIHAQSTNDTSPISLSISGAGGKKSKFEIDIFLEANINRGDDGGLYAELIFNRAFQEGGGTLTGWNGIGETSLYLSEANPLSWAIPKSVSAFTPSSNTSSKLGFYNTGWFSQLPIFSQTYNASFWARADGAFPNASSIEVGLWNSGLNESYATATVDASLLTDEWQQFHVTLYSNSTAPSASNVFAITLPSNASATAYFTLISLFPPTFNNVPNGLRVDLAQALADIKPKYIRWPGGNDLEGSTIAQRFNWTASVGPLRYRPGRPGTWNGYATGGLGLMEVFDWAESVGIKPLLGVYAGYSLDHSTVPNTTALNPYITDALNEIHFMLDPANSSNWSALRAKYGRVDPYDLDTLEIGNEDNLGTGRQSYNYRFHRFKNAITNEFPNKTFNFIATDYVSVPDAPGMDIHDYVVADTFIDQYTRYDNYPRNHTTLYALEYAVLTGDYLNPNSTDLFVGDESSNRYLYPELRGSIAEWIYSMGMERNGDLMKGVAYAPLFHNVPLPRDELWLPDLISFNATVVARSTSYWIQWLLGNSHIDTILNVTSSAPAGPIYWSAGSTNSSSTAGLTYFLKLANTGTNATSSSFSFTSLPTASSGVNATTWTLAAPAGFNETVSNPIDAPDRVVPSTSPLNVTVQNSTLSGSVDLPAWSAVLVRIDVA